MSIRDSLDYRARLVAARATALACDNLPVAMPLNSELAPLLKELQTKGFVKLPFFVGQVDSVAEKVRDVFAKAAESDRKVVGQNIRDPFLFSRMPGKVISEPRLNQLVQAYLGADATFDFAQIFRIPATTDNVTLSGLWHHDRVGKRLKLFVYLHDVRPGERITRYATGSHRRQHIRWSHKGSRYEDAWIDRRYDVDLFEGRTGEAYLFDTNGIHRATWERNASYRDALYFEWSSYRKSRIMRRLGYHIGICREQFPQGFDAQGTLVHPAHLRAGETGPIYGETTPKFNFIN